MKTGHYRAAPTELGHIEFNCYKHVAAMALPPDAFNKAAWVLFARWRNGWNNLAFVPAVDAEIFIHGDNAVLWM